ncbi:MAG: tryptophan synthase subunit beta [Bacteroidales bacterium]
MNKETITLSANKKGFYGRYGGAFIPEILQANITELTARYQEVLASSHFRTTYKKLLQQYVGRPTPLYFANSLSQKYGYQIYLKREDLNHTGSHKINNTVGQALIAQALNKKEIIAETGAGQHGVATATVCALLDLSCTIYMGETDMERQATNVQRMKMLGANVIPATSGNGTLKDAINEALRAWSCRPEETFYLMGSVVGPHPYPTLVAQLQSIISEEIKDQLYEETGYSNPSAILACVGGGSNAAGAFYHYLHEPDVLLLGAEAAGKGVDSGQTAASIARGHDGVLHGSYSRQLQNADGQIIEPYSISAGLDYPGIGPLHAHLAATGRARYIPVTDQEALVAGRELALFEGIIPALESAHALALLKKLPSIKGRTLVINLSGRGDKDLTSYNKNLSL